MAKAVQAAKATATLPSTNESGKDKERRKRTPPQGPYGVVYADRETAEKPECTVFTPGEANQFNLWEIKRREKPSSYVWARGQQEAFWLVCGLPNLCDDEHKDRPFEKVARADGGVRGRVKKLLPEHVTLIKRLCERIARDAASEVSILAGLTGANLVHLTPYVRSTERMAIPDDLANDPLVKLYEMVQ